MADYLRSARTALRSAALISIAVVYLALAFGSEGDHSRAAAELEAYLKIDAGLYEYGLNRALANHSNDAQVAAILEAEAGLCSVLVEQGFPDKLPLQNRTNTTRNALIWYESRRNVDDIRSLIEQIPEYSRRAKYLHPDEDQIRVVSSAIFEALNKYGATLTSYRLVGAPPGEETRLQLHFLIDRVDVPDSVQVSTGRAAVITNRGIHQGSEYVHYEANVDCQYLDVYGSFASFFVDSLAFHVTRDSLGNFAYTDLKSVYNEIADMPLQEALRYLKQNENDKEPTGTVMSLPYDFRNSSWLPLAVNMVLLLYGYIHIYVARSRRSSLTSSGFAWLAIGRGLIPTLFSIVIVFLPVAACIVAILQWSNFRALNCAVLLGSVLMAVGVFVELRRIGRYDIGSAQVDG